MNIFLFFRQNRMPVCKTNNAMKIFGRYVVSLVACVSCMQAQSQLPKSSVQLADQYFASGEYFTAANLYEQYLNATGKQRSVSNFPVNSIGKRRRAITKGVSRIDILFK